MSLLTEIEATLSFEILSPSFTELFHRINNLIPDSQELITVSPSTPVKEAMQIMQDKNFSQLPVVEGNEVLGLFSFRSFATEIISMVDPKTDFGDLPVGEFLESPEFFHIYTELETIFTPLNRLNSVLIGLPNRLQSIVTPMDVLKYLFRVTSPFIMVEEIELTLRRLISACVDQDQLQVCITNSLTNTYKDKELPSKLEDMSFNDYVQIIGDGRNWPKFLMVFGEGEWQRKRTRTKLEEIRDLRNDVFHFRRELTSEDRGMLSTHRNWLLTKARAFEAKKGH